MVEFLMVGLSLRKVIDEKNNPRSRYLNQLISMTSNMAGAKIYVMCSCIAAIIVRWCVIQVLLTTSLNANVFFKMKQPVYTETRYESNHID